MSVAEVGKLVLLEPISYKFNNTGPPQYSVELSLQVIEQAETSVRVAWSDSTLSHQH